MTDTESDHPRLKELQAAAGDGSDGFAEAGDDGWRIDRNGPYPLYYQLKQALLHAIRSQGLRPGDQLPTEGEIESRFGVSRTTIRQALSELVADGIVERVQGKGTFVAAPKIQHVAMLTSFTENMRAQGYVPTRQVLESVQRPATADVGTVLEIEEGAPCWFLNRLLLADERPVGLAASWIAIDALDGNHGALQNLGPGSLYEFLQAPPFSLTLYRGVETITADVITDKATADLLDCARKSSVLSVNRITWLAGGRPLEWTKMIFASDRYEYRVELLRPNLR